jgi:integrase/recombinase XerD
MALVLRGDAWYLRKQIGGKRQDHALKVFGGEANRKKAERAATALERTLMQGAAGVAVLKKLGLEPAPKPVEDANDSLTMADWWKKYQEVYSSQKAKRTQSIDKYIMAHWIPLLGSSAMADIRQIDCLRAMNERRKAKQANPGHKHPTVIKESTVQRERRLLHALFERAVENEIIDKNPWTAIEKVADTPRSERILTEPDETTLIATLRDPQGNAGNVGRAEPERYVRFVTFMLETGLRIDELLNDKFKDEGDHITVVGKGSKRREVPLTKKARKALDEQVKADGRVWWQTPARFRDVLASACERAGITHISPHDLRHTFGHRYLVKGGDIYTLSKILGHASIDVTAKHYAYLSRENIATKMLAVMDP